MKLHIAVLVSGLALLPVAAHAAVTFEYLFDNGYATSVSYDGKVVAGNTTGDYDPFRWTQATGLVRLERSAAQIVGTSGGQPGISYDGTRIASTIASSDSQYVTAGLWTFGQGWNQIAPPVPPLGGIVDKSLCDVWGMSPDGSTVVGLLWRSVGGGPVPGGNAHAYRWRQNTGMVDLGSSGRSSRAGPGPTSFNGSVIAGFDEHPQYGYRRPCAWRDTTRYQLGDYDAIGEGVAVSTNGEWVVGHERNLGTNTREAARWHWDGSEWSPTEYLGAIDGTAPDQGIAIARAISSDGKIVIGYDSYNGDPFTTTGLIWTDSLGVATDINFWLADHDVPADPYFTIQDLTAMTPDGRTIIGIGQMTVAPYSRRSFAIHLDRPLVTGVAPSPVSAPALQLSASPNPARSGTSFTLALPSAGRAEFSLYDATGRRIRTLIASDLSAGTHSVKWDGRDDSGARVGAGVYFTRLQVGASSTGGKLVVIE